MSYVSLILTSNAPFGLLPVFSTMIANFTRSLPATFESVASMGFSCNPPGGPDVMVPVKEAPAFPGSTKLTFGGKSGDPVGVPGVNSPFALLVDTTPLVMVSSGSPTVT